MYYGIVNLKIFVVVFLVFVFTTPHKKLTKKIKEINKKL